jgi:serine/threonine-protein kinase
VQDSGRDAVETIAAEIADDRPIDWEGWKRRAALTDSDLRALRALETMWRARAAALDDSSEGSASLFHEARFQIRSEIRREPSLRAYHAVDLEAGREVVLKWIGEEAFPSPEARDRFLGRMRVLARIEHPHLVRVHSAERMHGCVRLCLERVEGSTLARIVKERGPLATREAARIGADLCGALGTLHSRGIVHRDIDASNVISGPGGRTVLLEMGVPMAADPEAPPRCGSAAGRTHFAPPELITAGRTGHRGDLYALGVLLYWLVSGRFPFEARTVGELRRRILSSRPIPLRKAAREVPRAFASLAEKAMARKPEDRFESAWDMSRALRAFLEEEDFPEIGPLLRARRLVRRLLARLR